MLCSRMLALRSDSRCGGIVLTDQPTMKKATRKRMAFKIGRDGQIRTDDILLPKQALYQAELRPVTGRGN